VENLTAAPYREEHMRADTIARAVAFALIVAGTSILAAPAQTTAQPGQMTQARVWIQNRGRSEAVPIELRDVNLDTPLKVQVINGDATFSRASPVQVTELRKTWDYDMITVTSTGDDVAKVLTAKGTAGWETTGIAFVTADGTKLLLKRPR
jgi:hypothetical protein